MQPSRLSSHELKKGRFITPFNMIGTSMSDEESWVYGRLPEYIWIGLIFDFYGRSEALYKLREILQLMKAQIPSLHTLRLSDIFLLDSIEQIRAYEIMLEFIDREVLSPLTVIFTLSKHREFVRFFYDSSKTETRILRLNKLLMATMDHQSDAATDIRFIVLLFWYQQGKLHIPKETSDLLDLYAQMDHSAEMMKRIRPTVRALELMALKSEELSSDYLNCFWKELSKLTECNLYYVEYQKEERELKEYQETLYGILVYLTELYEHTNPLDRKMKVLIGVFTYSYKRFKEAIDHELFSTISGRSIIRVIIEDYIMMKYLCMLEADKPSVWEDYEMYGIGQYKLILEKSREWNTNLKSPHFDEEYIELLVNEYKNEEFIDMDTKYFGSDNVRVKADKVNEKDLYGLLYDYDSAFEHGLWGAIRESSLLKCDNPAHQYHCVPDCDDNIVLKSTADDCVAVLNRTILFLNDVYGIPENLINEAIEFEKKLTIEHNKGNTD